MKTALPRRRIFRLWAPALTSAAVVGAVIAWPGAAGSVLAQQQRPQQQPDQRPQRASLAQGIPNFSLEATPLEDALSFLQNMTGVTFYIDWQRLEMAGVDRGTPVTLQLRGTSIRKTLNLVLDAASPLEPLTFYVESGVVHITTLEHADSELVLRIYDVRDLLVDVPDFFGPGLNMGGGGGGGGMGGGGGGGTGGGGGGFGGGGGGGGYGGGGGGNQGGGGGSGMSGGGSGGGGNGGGTGGSGGSVIESQEERAEELIELITEVVRPDIWKDNGGTATISYFQGNLVVNAPRSVHELL